MLDNNRIHIINGYLDAYNHDVRTLVSSILGLAVIGENDVNNPEKAGECFSSIRSTAKSLLECIDDNMSRLKEQLGNGKNVEELFDMKKLLATIREGADVAKHKSVVTVEDNLNDEDSEVLIGDLHRIKYVIYQVIDELEARNAKHISIRVFSNEICVGKSRVVNIAFFDDGEVRNKSEKKDLYSYELARQFIRNMNGEIKFDVEEEKNVIIISLFFNIHNIEAMACENEPDEAEEEEIDSEEFAGVRILFVEDNELNAEIIKEVIELHGASVDWAINGYDALKFITDKEEKYYDLILMDLQMPDMDGFETTRAIRRLNMSYTREVPILALTANVLIGSIQEALAVGMDNYLVKPIEISDLRHVINKYVKRLNITE